MRFLITKPAYVGGQHLGAEATLANPIEISIPDDAGASLEWIPLDEKAKEAHDFNIEQKIEGISVGRDPKDAGKVTLEIAQLRKRFTRTIAKPPEAPKEVPHEVDTNAEMAAGKRKVVGRAADKSPV
jgi:hypothetical protein